MRIKQIQLLAAIMLLSAFFTACERPKEKIVLKTIRDVVADASSDPRLRAQAVFYNPNDIKGRLKNIDVQIYVNGKKAGLVKKDYKISIPAKGEFTVPLEVELNMKELGTLSTLFGMIGGKKFDIQYKGNLKLSYHGIPFNVPIDYKDEVRIKF